MKKIFLAATFILCAGVAVNAAEISKVIVRQQWPWSADVKAKICICQCQRVSHSRNDREHIDDRNGILNTIGNVVVKTV